MAPRVVDLFCGTGGFSLGMQQAGYHIAAAYDFWPAGCENYRINMPDYKVIETDLGEGWPTLPDSLIDSIASHSPNVIVGGPPCQDFSLMTSISGKRTEAQRANMTIRFAEIVRAIRPELVIMENVPQALDSKSYAVARKIFPGHIQELILDASFYGVPQARQRLIVIITRNKCSQIGLDILRAASRKPLTVAEYTNIIPDNYWLNHIGYPYYTAIHSIHRPCRTILTSSQIAMPLKLNFTPCYYRGQHRLTFDKRHITTNVYLGHPQDNAPFSKAQQLTIPMVAMLQSFPFSWTWPPSISTAVKMIGNAVPPEMIRQVATIIKKHIWP